MGERLQADCCNMLICLEISQEGEEINSELQRSKHFSFAMELSTEFEVLSCKRFIHM